MTERPTPETDAARVPALEVAAWVEVVNVDLARRLERERDEARATRDRLALSLQTKSTAIEQIRAERDALRDALREACPAPGVEPRAWWKRTEELLGEAS